MSEEAPPVTREMPQAELPPALYRDYVVTAQIKRGAAAWVLRVRARRDGRPYILKVTQGEEAIARLKAEFFLLRKLEKQRSALVPTPVSFYEDEKRAYLVEEYLSGHTVEDLVQRHGPLDAASVCRIGAGLCDALSLLHRQRPPVIHRDIKPEHIMVDERGAVKLIDLGIARRYQPRNPRDTKQLGTEATAAPEQYGYQQSDARTDIYAAGITFLYMLTGDYDPKGLSSASIPKALKRIILRCIRFVPEKRYHSACALKLALLRAARPRRARLGLGALAAALLAFLLIFLARRSFAVV